MERSRKMVQVLDDMSDTLCRVADLADCVRMLHPNREFRRAAADACQSIGCLVEELNTVPELYESSVRARHSPLPGIAHDPIAGTIDSIDDRVLDLFIADFQLSGVHLQSLQRHREYRSTAAAALNLGAQFVEASYTPVMFQPPGRQEQVQLSHPLLDDPRSDLRATTYQAYYSPIFGQEDRLIELMRMRHRMAQAAGFQTYIDRATQYSIAGTAHRIDGFLHHACRLLAPVASSAAQEHLISAMRQLNKSDDATSIPQQANTEDRLWPWDVAFALNAKRQMNGIDELSAYFSLGACMEGVSQLAECLFGLRLLVEPIAPGEQWHPDVIKIGVYATNESIPGAHSGDQLGTIYCDLLDRPGKPAQDCHYTIRGGRRLPGGQYQNPIITLQLTLTPPSPRSPTPSLLTPAQVENLFHEWGHALHSILARTRYQHVTGTRCSTDLAELPSTLFERFALDPRVTAEYARHWSTGKAPGREELNALKHLVVLNGLGNSVELIQQAAYARLDHVLHSGDPETTLAQDNAAAFPSSRSSRSSVKSTLLPASTHLLARIKYEAGLSDWLICDPTPLGAWTHRFSHLVGYGGRYYAYLMARAGAQLVWRHGFADDPWSSKNGQLYAQKILSHGGEFHPSQMLADYLTTDTAPNDQTSPSELSPEKLAQGLADHAEESETAASNLLMRLSSPGLHQSTHRVR